jgi:hypothetical protein
MLSRVREGSWGQPCGPSPFLPAPIFFFSLRGRPRRRGSVARWRSGDLAICGSWPPTVPGFQPSRFPGCARAPRRRGCRDPRQGTRRPTSGAEWAPLGQSGNGHGAPPGRPPRVPSGEREMRWQFVAADHRECSSVVDYAGRSATSPPLGMTTAQEGNREMTPTRSAILPHLDAERILEIYRRAPGSEVKSGKFNSPQSWMSSRGSIGLRAIMYFANPCI